MALVMLVVVKGKAASATKAPISRIGAPGWVLGVYWEDNRGGSVEVRNVYLWNVLNNREIPAELSTDAT